MNSKIQILTINKSIVIFHAYILSHSISIVNKGSEIPPPNNKKIEPKIVRHTEISRYRCPDFKDHLHSAPLQNALRNQGFSGDKITILSPFKVPILTGIPWVRLFKTKQRNPLNSHKKGYFYTLGKA